MYNSDTILVSSCAFASPCYFTHREFLPLMFKKVDRKTLNEVYHSLLEWDNDSENIVSSLSLPSLCILTDENLCSYDEIKRIAPQFILGKVIGSKCWATLEAPEQVNAMIERFLVTQKRT